MTNPYNSISIGYFITMAILTPIIIYTVRRFLNDSPSNFRVYLYLFIITKSYWISVASLFIIGYAFRHSLEYFATVFVVLSSYFDTFFNLDFNHVKNMMPNNNQRAGRINGAVHVADPFNQNYQYQMVGTNQPLLSNLAIGLENQRRLGLCSLSQNTFTPEQERYVLAFLLDKHPNVYNNIMQGQTGNINRPAWWKQSNTKQFHQLLINAQ